MKHVNTIVGTLVLLWFIPLTILAQNNTVAGSGSASGSGGSSTFTVGQISSGTVSGTNGSATQGVQQPIEITVITGITDRDIDLTARIFPNPATDFLILSIKHPQLIKFSYVLTDLQGRVLQQNKLTDSKTNIPLAGLNAGAYFLKVSKEGGTVKTFKIIKNK